MKEEKNGNKIFLENDMDMDNDARLSGVKKPSFGRRKVFFRFVRFRFFLLRVKLVRPFAPHAIITNLLNFFSLFFLILFFCFNSPAVLSVSLFFDSKLSLVRRFVLFAELNSIRKDIFYIMYIIFKKQTGAEIL